MTSHTRVAFSNQVSILIAVMMLFVLPAAAQRLITTVAGTDLVVPDGTQATDLPLSTGIFGIAVDKAGNLYVPDPTNAVVFKIGPDGTSRVIAGNTLKGFSGDGGPATSASLNNPFSVAIDIAGNLYIADQGNLRIRKIMLDGT